MSASDRNIPGKNLCDSDFYNPEFYSHQTQQHYSSVMKLIKFAPNRQPLVDLGISHPKLIHYLLCERLFNHYFEKEDLERFLKIENSQAAEAIFCTPALRKLMGLNDMKECIAFYATHQNEIENTYLSYDILRVLLFNEYPKQHTRLFNTPPSHDRYNNHSTETKAASSATPLSTDLIPKKPAPRRYNIYEIIPPPVLVDVISKDEDEDISAAIALSLQTQEDEQYVKEKQSAIEATGETSALLSAIRADASHDNDLDDIDLGIDTNNAAAAVNAVESDVDLKPKKPAPRRYFLNRTFSYQDKVEVIEINPQEEEDVATKTKAASSATPLVQADTPLSTDLDCEEPVPYFTHKDTFDRLAKDEDDDLETAIKLSRAEAADALARKLQKKEDEEYVQDKLKAIQATNESYELLAAIRANNLSHDIDPDDYDLDIVTNNAAAAVNAVESDDEYEGEQRGHKHSLRPR